MFNLQHSFKQQSSNQAPFIKRGVMRLGFTLLEMLIVMSIVGILLSFAYPNFKQFIRAAEVKSLSAELNTAINFARSEAIRQNQSVSLCATNDMTNCDNLAITWQKGWLIFTDLNGDGVLNSAGSINDTLLKKNTTSVTVADNTEEHVAITLTPSSVKTIQYLPSGLMMPAQTLENITLCTPDKTTCRTICVNPVGAARLAQGATCN